MNLGGVEGQASVRKRPGLWSPLRAAGLRDEERVSLGLSGPVRCYSSREPL